MKTIKFRLRSLQAFFTLLLAITLLGLNTSYGQIAWSDSWQHNATEQFGGGDGTQNNPYLIKTARHLGNMAWCVAWQDWARRHYKLMADIDMNQNYWIPAGHYSEYVQYSHEIKTTAFTGSFDGNGYTISNIWLNYLKDNIFRTDYLGFFGYVKGGTIKNLTLSNIHCVDETWCVGALAGGVENSVTIENCRILNGYITTKGGGRSCIGGLVGYVYGNVNTSLYIYKSSVENLRIENNGVLAPGGIVGRVGASSALYLTDVLSAGTLVKYSTVNSAFGNLVGCLDAGSNAYLSRVVAAATFDATIPVAARYNAGAVNGGNFRNNNSSASFFIRSDYVNYYDQNFPSSYASYRTIRDYSEMQTMVLAHELNTTCPTEPNRYRWGRNVSPNWTSPTATRPAVKISVNEGAADIIKMVTDGNTFNASNAYCGPDGTTTKCIITVTNKDAQHLMPVLKARSGIANNNITRTSANTFEFLVTKNDIVVDLEYQKIPHITHLNATFSTSKKNIYLSGGITNMPAGPNVGGGIYVFRSKNNENFVRLTDTPLPSTATGYTEENVDYNATYRYKIGYVEGFYSTPAEIMAHTTHIQEVGSINTTPLLPISVIRATPTASSVILNWNIGTDAAALGGVTFKIQRKAEAAGSPWLTSTSSYTHPQNVAAGNFTDDGTIGGLGMITPCGGYYYRLIYNFPAAHPLAGVDFISSEVKSNLVSVDAIETFEATKSEYPSAVRLHYILSPYTTAPRKVFERRLAETSNPWNEIYRITNSELEGYYTDITALPGLCYEYRFRLQTDCGDNNFGDRANKIDIGFPQAQGTIAGKITYGSGTAVKDVKVTVQMSDEENQIDQFRGLQFTQANSKAKWDYPSVDVANTIYNNFSVQMFVNPDIAITNTIKLLDLEGLAYLRLNKLGDRFTFTTFARNASNVMVSGNFDAELSIHANKFTHIAFTRSGNNLTLYVVNDENRDSVFIQTSTITLANLGGNIVAVNSGIALGGDGFIGFIDEVRLWNKTLTLSEIQNNHDRYLSGTEANLFAYWKFDEGLTNHFFDCSSQSGMPNRHHGTLNQIIPTKILPSPWQLALLARTDLSGSYLIRGIPFHGGDGSNYKIVPMFGIHTFNPTHEMRYISTSSLTHNAVDFKDVSAFPVSGTVVFEGGNYPVAGCNFYVDGQIIASQNGSVVESNLEGRFTVDVPIGTHSVQVRKQGHTFANDGFLLNYQGQNYTYNDKMTGVILINTTKVDIVGRVAGGIIESEKPLGYGKSFANIGKATIQLKAQDIRYNINTSGAVIHYPSGRATATPTATVIRSKASIPNNSGIITIITDSINGEFIVSVPPIPYTLDYLQTATVSNLQFTDVKAAVPLIDIDPKIPKQPQLLYSIPDTANPTQINILDSLKYNHKLNLCFRTDDLNMDIFDRNAPLNSGVYGDSLYIYTNDVGDTTHISLATKDAGGVYHYTYGFPIFRMANTYIFGVKSYERYFNKDVDPANPVETRVPSKSAKVTFMNDLGKLRLETSENPNTEPDAAMAEYIQLDNNGEGTYAFKAGFPNMISPFTYGLNATMTIENKNYDWSKNGIFKGIVLGDKPLGAGFVTEGPKKADFVLRDPPGTNSYSYIEQGTTITRSRSVTNGVNQEGGVDFVFNLGMTTNVGVGVVVFNITSFEAKHTIHAGTSHNITNRWSSNETNSITITERIQTSDDKLYVGADADVYIGTSTNLYYGKSKALGIKKQGNNYVLEVYDNFLVTPTGEPTAFNYTQDHILNNLIPEINSLRNSKISVVTPAEYANPLPHPSIVRYVSQITATDANFGKRGFYKMVVPTPNGMYVDEIQEKNTQIANWENIIKTNEKQKIDSKINADQLMRVQNRSFDAGSIFETSTSVSTIQSKTDVFNAEFAAYVGSDIGFRFNFWGLITNLEEKMGYVHGYENQQQVEKHTTYGYVLKDEDYGDYFAVDVFTPKAAHTLTEAQKEAVNWSIDNNVISVNNFSSTGSPIFITRGGVSSCPHQKQEVTLFYQPGTEISPATIALEDPKITVTNPIVTNIPTGGQATYQIQLKNETSTPAWSWYKLSLVEESNPDGLILTIDGVPLTAGGRLFKLEPNQIIHKTLVARQSDESILNYEDIKIKLGSDCQIDLFDETAIVARFAPSCSDVSLQTSATLLNTTRLDGAHLELTMRDYNLQYTNFYGIQLQYKRLGDNDWTLLQQYVANPANVNENNILISGSSVVKNFDMTTYIDGTYEFRARSMCTYGTGYLYVETPIITVIKDMTRPKILGNPSPSDGILSPGEEISIQFNEAINTGMVTWNNFEVKGIRNGGMLEHETSVQFNGVGTKLTTEHPITLNSSFTMEAWVKRNALTAGTVLSHGGNLTLGFDANNKLKVNINGITFQSVATYTQITDWMHIAVAYNAENFSFEAIVNDDIVCTGTASKYSNQDKFYVGADVNTNYFNGLIHGVRLWNTKLEKPTIYANMSVNLSGTEYYLIGCWDLDEVTPINSGEITCKDKARYRHLFGNAAWHVSPSGFALNLATNSKIQVNTSASVVINYDRDFSLEFWFNGAPQTNVCLFSCGRGDVDHHIANKLSVIIDAQGKMILTAKERLNTITNTNYLDNQWHHFAISVNRAGTANVYIDNSLKATFPASYISGLSNGFMYLGKRVWSQQVGAEFETLEDMDFVGQIDELRFWNIALLNTVIGSRYNTRLSGNEVGLLAYYPFDKYITNNNIKELIFSDADQSHANLSGALVLTNTASTNQVPTIKNVTTIDNLEFNYTVSSDKIVIALSEEAQRISNIEVAITVKDIQDFSGNKTSGDYHWTAFIDNKSLLWNETDIQKNKPVGQPLSFTTTIRNRTGIPHNYLISELPTWLKISPNSGVMAANSNLTITFNIDANAPIGNYFETILLTNLNDLTTDILSLSVRVLATPPPWIVIEANFEYSMDIIGIVKKNDEIIGHADDKLAAFIGDLCVGICHPTYINQTNTFMDFITIFGNNGHNNKHIDFKYWEASTGNIYIISSQPIYPFQQNAIYGTLSEPVIFTITNLSDQYIGLAKGWSWISIYGNAASNEINDVFESAKVGSIQNVKSQLQFAVNNLNFLVGSLTQILPKKMYMVKSNILQNITVQVENLDQEDKVIYVNTGWNWIGYTETASQTINEALAGFEATNGDMLRAQNRFAVYDNAMGWVGSLTSMLPGFGYKMKVAHNSSFTISKPANSIVLPKNFVDDTTHYKVNPHDFEQSASVIGGIYEDVDWAEFNGEVGFFVGNECRGVARSTSIQTYNGAYFFATVYSNNTSETMTIKLYNYDNSQETLSPKQLTFKVDSVYGSIPIRYNLMGPDNISVNENDFTAFNVYPNPTTGKLRITNYEKSHLGDLGVYIYDIYGKLIYYSKFIIHNSIDLSNYSPGIYFVKIGNKAVKVVKL